MFQSPPTREPHQIAQNEPNLLQAHLLKAQKRGEIDWLPTCTASCHTLRSTLGVPTCWATSKRFRIRLFSPMSHYKDMIMKYPAINRVCSVYTNSFKHLWVNDNISLSWIKPICEWLPSISPWISGEDSEVRMGLLWGRATRGASCKARRKRLESSKWMACLREIRQEHSIMSRSIIVFCLIHLWTITGS